MNFCQVIRRHERAIAQKKKNSSQYKILLHKKYVEKYNKYKVLLHEKIKKQVYKLSFINVSQTKGVRHTHSLNPIFAITSRFT